MLQKIRGVRQDDASRTRDWFQDDFFDLFVWSEASGAVVAFQLCYDRLKHERVLAWNREGGFLHRRVDDGEHTPIKNMSPILVTDGIFASGALAAEFGERATNLDSAVREFIARKIAQADAGLRSGAAAA
jgi:hypothetical protein